MVSNNSSKLVTKSEIKMGGYWPNSFSCVFMVLVQKTQYKRTRIIFGHFEQTSLFNKEFMIWPNYLQNLSDRCGLAIISCGFMSHLIGSDTISIPKLFSGVHGYTGKTVIIHDIAYINSSGWASFWMDDLSWSYFQISKLWVYNSIWQFLCELTSDLFSPC